MRIAPCPTADGDIVTAHALTTARRNYVEIRGNVDLPGRFAAARGLRLSQLAQETSGMEPATFAGWAHTERLNLADSTRGIIVVELPSATAGQGPKELALNGYEVVTTYTRPQVRYSLVVVTVAE